MKWTKHEHLTGTAMLISELTRIDGFYMFFSTELLAFIECWQTGKEFRLPWHSFVRVELYYKYRLSINRNYWLFDLLLFHGEVVRVSASKSRGREFESQDINFPYQSIIIFYFLVFSFYISQFEVKQCANLYRKCDNTGFVIEKEVMLFYFSRLLIPGNIW